MSSLLGFKIATGQKLGNWSAVHKFGGIQSLPHNSAAATVWTGGVTYPWTLFNSAIALKVESLATDAGIVTVEGLDENYDPKTVDLQLTNIQYVSLPGTWKAVNRVEYVNADGTANTGPIKVMQQAGTGVVGHIPALQGQSRQAVYTVPKGYTAYITNYTVGTGKEGEAEVGLYIREPGSAFKNKSNVSVRGQCFQQNFDSPLVVPQKSNIDFKGNSGSSGTSAIVNFEIWLKKV